jgi:hypothetical protein
MVRASAPLTSLVIEGMVRDVRVPPRLPAETPWRWEFRAAADGGVSSAALDAALDLPVDDRHRPVVALRLTLALGASLLDGVELSAASGGLLGGPAEQRLLQNLREGTFLTATVTRTDH